MIHPLNSLYTPSKIVAIGAFASILLGTGCSQRSGVTLLQPAPSPIHISLIQLARSSAEWSSVSQMDAVARLSTQQPPPLPLVISQVIAPLDSSSSSSLASTTRMSAARSEASRRAASGLSAAADRAVSEVRARLERNQSQLRSLAQDRAAKQVALGLRDARNQAIKDYLANLPSVMQDSATQRANLRVQISALGVDANPANPQTAPDDYWGKLLKAREAELANLTDTQLAAQRQAEQQISVQVEAAREALQKAADSQLADYEGTLDTRRARVLARQHEALQKEQMELTAVSNELDSELNQPLRANAAPAVVGQSSNTIVAGGALNVVSASAVSRLQMQRQRLEQTILDTTRRRAVRAADELNLKIVDWNSRKPDTKAMDELSKQMSRDVTG